MKGVDNGPDRPLSDRALIEALVRIAERAGQVILGYYRQEAAIEVQEKSDSSPVTAADEAAETLILGALNTMSPDIPVIAEEAMAAGEEPDIPGEAFWLVDPLDGTKEFLSGNGEFTVNIALIERGLPIAGVVHAPALGRTWTGVLSDDGPAAYFREDGRSPEPIGVRPAPADGLTVVASRRHGQGSELDDFLSAYPVRDQVSAGSSLKFCLVASGQADLYPRFGRTMEWDTAAGHAVLLAAGGRVMTIEGAPLRYRKPGFENPYFFADGTPDPEVTARWPEPR